MITKKQKNYLRAKANSLKPIFQIGKDGIHENLIKTIDDSLEAHELIKISVLKNCEEDIKELAFDLSYLTNSNLIQIVGRIIILYRRSQKPKIELPNE